jgi:tRNA U34 2-thiouridine synthase MnmA/TrmU
VRSLTWSDRPVDGAVYAQCSAHGAARLAQVVLEGSDLATVRWTERRGRVAPGQSVVFYDDAHPDEVVGGGIAA